MIRVVLVDDQAMVRRGFRVLLEEHPDIEIVGEASGGRAAVRLVAKLKPDVVCMDLRMPEGDGMEATRQIVDARTGDTPAVLVVTTFDMDEDVFGALEAGADGFILKDCEPEELAKAVRSLAGGFGLIDHNLTRTQNWIGFNKWTEPRRGQLRATSSMELLKYKHNNLN